MTSNGRLSELEKKAALCASGVLDRKSNASLRSHVRYEALKIVAECGPADMHQAKRAARAGLNA